MNNTGVNEPLNIWLPLDNLSSNVEIKIFYFLELKDIIIQLVHVRKLYCTHIELI